MRFACCGAELCDLAMQCDAVIIRVAFCDFDYLSFLYWTSEVVDDITAVALHFLPVHHEFKTMTARSEFKLSFLRSKIVVADSSRLRQHLLQINTSL